MTLRRPYPEGFESKGWNLTAPNARSSYLDIGASIAEQAEWLTRVAPRYLQTYPSTATALAEHFLRSGKSLKLWAVMTVGESVTPEARASIHDAFGCVTVDHYGATELGYLAFQCPAGDGYHIAHETVRVEVVDDSGQAAARRRAGARRRDLAL